MKPPRGHNIGSYLLVEPEYPRRPNGDPYQVLFHWDDETGRRWLALSDSGEPLVWAPNDSDKVEEWEVEIAPPEIAAAALTWDLNES